MRCKATRLHLKSIESTSDPQHPCSKSMRAWVIFHFPVMTAAMGQANSSVFCIQRQECNNSFYTSSTAVCASDPGNQLCMVDKARHQQANVAVSLILELSACRQLLLPRIPAVPHKRTAALGETCETAILSVHSSLAFASHQRQSFQNTHRLQLLNTLPALL